MPRTIEIDAALDRDLEAYEAARAAREAAPDSRWRSAYDRELDAALDLARAVLLRTKGEG